MSRQWHFRYNAHIVCVYKNMYKLVYLLRICFYTCRYRYDSDTPTSYIAAFQWLHAQTVRRKKLWRCFLSIFAARILGPNGSVCAAFLCACSKLFHSRCLQTNFLRQCWFRAFGLSAKIGAVLAATIMQSALPRYHWPSTPIFPTSRCNANYLGPSSVNFSQTLAVTRA